MSDCISDCAVPGDFAGSGKPMEELKPCPFCDSHSHGWHKRYRHEIERDGTLYQPFCRRCGASCRAKKTKTEAIAAWNHRSSPWIKVDVIPKPEPKFKRFSVDFLMWPMTTKGYPLGAYDIKNDRWSVPHTPSNYTPKFYMPIPQLPE